MGLPGFWIDSEPDEFIPVDPASLYDAIMENEYLDLLSALDATVSESFANLEFID